MVVACTIDPLEYDLWNHLPMIDIIYYYLLGLSGVWIFKHYAKEGQIGFSWLCSSLELRFSCFYLLTIVPNLHFVFIEIIILNWCGKCLN